MSEVMMLAKGYTPKSLEFPVYVTEKLDGVPVDIRWNEDQTVTFTSRQGKPILSVEHLRKTLEYAMVQPGTHLVGELYIDGMDFKDISGLARKKEQCSRLVLNVFDMHFEYDTFSDYYTRINNADILVDNLKSPSIKMITRYKVTNQEMLDAFIAKYMKNHPDAEGVVIRNWNGRYELKRSYAMQKYKVTNTADLEIVSFEEALDAKTDEPLHMVGRINCLYKGAVIGVGPGTMDHATRKEVWKNTGKYAGKIIEVKYMPDDSYTALREARFFRWREDKTVGE